MARRRMALLGLLVLTVVASGAVALDSPRAPAVVGTALQVVLMGLLVLLWACWMRAERRQP